MLNVITNKQWICQRELNLIRMIIMIHLGSFSTRDHTDRLVLAGSIQSMLEKYQHLDETFYHNLRPALN